MPEVLTLIPALQAKQNATFPYPGKAEANTITNKNCEPKQSLPLVLCILSQQRET